MCDPVMDVSMCAIYSYYNEEDMERLFQALSPGGSPRKTNCLLSMPMRPWADSCGACGLYIKSILGDEFGEYTIIMYRYAKKIL